MRHDGTQAAPASCSASSCRGSGPALPDQVGPTAPSMPCGIFTHKGEMQPALEHQRRISSGYAVLFPPKNPPLQSRCSSHTIFLQRHKLLTQFRIAKVLRLQMLYVLPSLRHQTHS